MCIRDSIQGDGRLGRDIVAVFVVGLSRTIRNNRRRSIGLSYVQIIVAPAYGDSVSLLRSPLNPAIPGVSGFRFRYRIVWS